VAEVGGFAVRVHYEQACVAAEEQPYAVRMPVLVEEGVHFLRRARTPFGLGPLGEGPLAPTGDCRGAEALDVNSRDLGGG